MICSSEENEEHPIETNNSRLMKWLGAEVIPCRKTEIAQTVEKTMNRLTEEGYHPYYIFGDKFGTGNEGTPVHTYVDGYREILAWEKEQNISFSHIFAASGTGSTQCGMVSGKLLEQGTEQIIYFRFHPASTTEPSASWRAAFPIILRRIISCCRKDGRVNFIWKWDTARADTDQYDERILQVIREEFCRNGLPLDPTYTGKAFWGMKQYIEEHQLQDCDVLFIHTGGTPLFYDCILNDTDGGKKMKLISIVIPCYNSEATIRKVVEMVMEEFKKMDGYDCEFVLVNDGSPKDNTYGEIKKLGEQYQNVKGINLLRNFGTSTMR